MKSYFLVLLTLFMPLAAFDNDSANEITKVAPQKVVYVLRELYDEGFVVILKDGSAWITRDSEPEIPSVGDHVKSSDGCYFHNMSHEGHYWLKPIGTIVYSPLQIKKMYSLHGIDLRKDSDSIHLLFKENDPEATSQTIQMFLDQNAREEIVLNYFFQLSNDLIYGFNNRMGFQEEWTISDVIQLIRKDEMEDQEYLVSLERGEIRPVKSIVYKTSRIECLNLDERTFKIEGDDDIWYTFGTYAEALQNWDNKNSIRYFTETVLEYDGLEIKTSPNLFLTFFMQQGTGILETTQKWSLSFALLLNTDTEEAVVAWRWAL